jgi:hypothetical protein
MQTARARERNRSERRSELMSATRAGEPFDVYSGLPVSEVKRRESSSFVQFAQSDVDVKWPDAAAKTRTSMVDALATVGTEAGWEGCCGDRVSPQAAVLYDFVSYAIERELLSDNPMAHVTRVAPKLSCEVLG